MSDNRKLGRISCKYNTELSAVIETTDGHQYILPIKDYNSSGISINFIEPMRFNIDHVDKLTLLYGASAFGVIIKPKIIRISKEEQKVVFSIRDNAIRDFFERDLRVDISDLFVGSISVYDPIKINLLLHFNIIQISQSGAKLSTSKSNRHILPGAIFKSAKIYLPCIGFINDGVFSVSYVEVCNDNIHLGIKYLNMIQSDKNKIMNYCIMNSNLEEVKRPEKKHKFEEAVRIERVSTVDQMLSVQKIRFMAYKNAGKIYDNLTEKDMIDEYDNHSIVLLATVGKKAVGTVRIVFGSDSATFPFEQYFKFDIIGNYKKKQVTEVSRLAIDPKYQGTDLLLKLFQGFAIEAMSKDCPVSVCLSTSKLAPYYLSIGAKKISDDISHPQLENETLAAYLFKKEDFESAKMSALAWFGFARKVVKHLKKHGILTSLPFDFFMYPLALIEFIKLRVLSKIKQQFNLYK